MTTARNSGVTAPPPNVHLGLLRNLERGRRAADTQPITRSRR
jgi:hypothetical protein